MSDENVLFTTEDNIAVLTINRPRALNALNKAVLDELDEMLSKVEDDEQIDVVIITGEGDKAFVAGADIGEMKDYNSLQAEELSLKGQEIFSRIEESNKVFIAAINGFALGGGLELAMACDLRIASEQAAFGQPEVKLGIIPGFGGTQRLPRLVGLTKAKELIYLGDNIDSLEAEKIGLINKIAEGTVLDDAIKMAKKIARNGQIAVGAAKNAVQKGMQMDINSAIDYEATKFSICFSTEDQKEGMDAFVNKRKPNFKNK